MTVMARSRKAGLPTSWFDRLGIGVSAFCILQCLALPLLVLFVPIAGAGLLSHELFHLLLLVVIVPVSALAFGLGFLRHRNPRMWVPAGIGIGLLAVAVALEHQHALPPAGIALLTASGGVALIIAHRLNMRLGSAPR
jgi:hypothetical protein